jgi:hypothetical protein
MCATDERPKSRKYPKILDAMKSEKQIQRQVRMLFNGASGQHFEDGMESATGQIGRSNLGRSDCVHGRGHLISFDLTELARPKRF